MGFGIPALSELASIAGMPDPSLISSFISARGLPGKGCSAARMGAGTVGRASNTSLLCAKLAVQAFCSSPPGEFLVWLKLLWRLFRCCGSLPVMPPRFAALREAFAAPGRCDGGSGGMTTAGDLFKFKIILFL